MTNFQHPFQCIQFLEKQETQENGSQKLLVASAGPKLYSYNAETGERLAVWPQDVDANKTHDSAAETDQAPPEKKRKVSPTAEEPVNDVKSGAKAPAWSNIPIVVATANSEHVVAMTAEDKTIRVFQLQADGTFDQLSERCMPKRPCSIALADDDRTIVCGDKFGDVYSLPLIPGNEPYVAPKLVSRPKVPAATPLTVHSKRNLESLEQQLRHQQQKKATEEKTGINFEHQLLLGHVSLLTDVAFVSLPSDVSPTGKRSYILTADRDEHIRVSRYPQAHIIENYCLGHNSFINKLCIPEWAPEHLISGGGDNYLLVWKWAEGQIVQKVSLVDEGSEDTQVAVRGLWAVSSENSKVILVALDGTSQLLCFTHEVDGSLKAQEPIETTGNVLDVTSTGKDNKIFVTVDSIREKNSTQEWRASPSTLIESFRVKSEVEALDWEAVTESPVTNINSSGTSDIVADADAKQRKDLNLSVYGLGNLRKKLGEDD
ncbi:WD40-repeat-containing domain protein [Aspergillus avenaceus]|uniref:WD40-repeat-containing domain protein n=1 Tax=Aspergillus avenaceus TaxID=36643 RepID=A0A5N6TMU0_ASPAV|nr:WD40-repeat-containing domain protein [Aspergillus avenaceus]